MEQIYKNFSTPYPDLQAFQLQEESEQLRYLLLENAALVVYEIPS